MDLLAQIIGTLVIVTNIIAMQMENKKQIIFMIVLGNFFSAISFILLNRYSGAIICLFAIAQTFINRKYEDKEQKVPNIIIGIYIIISIILGTITFKKLIDVLPIICSILFTITILQEKEKNIRIVSLINISLWLIYDILGKAYTPAISDLMMAISIITAMYRYDFNRKK